MPGFFQEKSQISGPPVHNDEVPDQWVEWSTTGYTARALGKAREDQSNVGEWVAKNSADTDMRRFNEMPPGMGIDQKRAKIEQMPLSMAGATDVSDDVTPKSFHEGFTRVDMKGTDDLYTGEHTDLWYGDVDGFVERNNYLDRN